MTDRPRRDETMTEPCECYKKLKYVDLVCRTPSEEFDVIGDEENSDYLEDEREFAVNIPYEIEINDSVSEYPNVQTTELPLLFQEMEEILRGVSDYDVNIFSFWLIDIFLEGLLTAQEAGMDHRSQNATLHWISYMYNVVKVPNNKNNRRETFKRIKFLLLAMDQDQDDADDYYDDAETVELEETIPSESRASNAESKKTEAKSRTSRKISADKTKVWEVPYPPNARFRFSTMSNTSSTGADTSRSSVTMKKSGLLKPSSSQRHTVTPDEAEAISKENVRWMQVILEIVYRIFGRLWSFMQLQAVLHSMPYLTVVDLPFKLNIPRPMLKFDSVSSTKQDKAGRRSYVPKTSEESSQGRLLSKKDFILPLQLAEGMDAFLRDLFSLPSQESMSVEKGKLERRKKFL